MAVAPRERTTAGLGCSPGRGPTVRVADPEVADPAHPREAMPRVRHKRGVFFRPSNSAHYSDYKSSIRSEVSNRRPVPNAYNSFVPSTTNGGDKDVKGGGGHDKGPCTRCGKKGHNKIKCFKPKTECHLCGADHLTAFCINAKGNHRRAELSRDHCQGAR